MKTHKSFTTEEKYNWLISKLKIGDIDFWESDAFIFILPMYFQFCDDASADPQWAESFKTKDDAIEQMMREEKK
jgi:hypothetical protein